MAAVTVTVVSRRGSVQSQSVSRRGTQGSATRHALRTKMPAKKRFTGIPSCGRSCQEHSYEGWGWLGLPRDAKAALQAARYVAAAAGGTGLKPAWLRGPARPAVQSPPGHPRARSRGLTRLDAA